MPHDGAYLMNPEIDPLRSSLRQTVGLPFAPAGYRVWRNYARVFEVTLLATNVRGRLAVTSLCRQLADELSASEYLSIMLRRTYMPSPAFEGYAPSNQRVFPFCAILKYLMARRTTLARTTLSEVFDRIIGNRCTGSEKVSHYLSLQPSGYKPLGDEVRQVREMLRFVSQLPGMSYGVSSLRLDLPQAANEMQDLLSIASPFLAEQKADRAEEILSLGSV